MAFVRMLEQLNKWDFRLIDARQEMEHMRSFVGELIAIEQFL
jgi:Leu/Phe-tRNA-protein transferase